MDAVRHAVHTGTYRAPKDQRVSLRDYLAEWLKGQRGQVRESTWESYSRISGRTSSPISERRVSLT